MYNYFYVRFTLIGDLFNKLIFCLFFIVLPAAWLFFVHGTHYGLLATRTSSPFFCLFFSFSYSLVLAVLCVFTRWHWLGCAVGVDCRVSAGLRSVPWAPPFWRLLRMCGISYPTRWRHFRPCRHASGGAAFFRRQTPRFRCCTCMCDKETIHSLPAPLGSGF